MVELREVQCKRNIDVFAFQTLMFGSTITKPFFPYRKDWSRVGVATLEKIGRDWKKDWKKDWLKKSNMFKG